MKKHFKFGCAALAAAMMCTGLAACGPIKRGGGGGGGGDDDRNSGSISVHYFVGGFGMDVNKALAADYKALTGISVKYVPSYSPGEIQSLVQSGQEKCDIVQPQLNLYQQQDSNLLEDLSDVYNAPAKGEQRLVSEKMHENLYEYIEARDGKRYQLFATDTVSAFCYNADTLDMAFGKGQWSLPRTTYELFEIGDTLKTKGVYTFISAVNITYDWDYMGNVWWAQYDGLEAYRNYYYGKYWDENAQEWKTGTAINDTDGRKYALDTMSKMLSKKNKYIHQQADRMNFEEAQIAFLGNGYVDDMKKCAFMVNGDWLENEMSSWLLSNPQNIGMMRTPVISQIINKLDTVNSDSKLAEVVQAVDDGLTEVAGVSAEDFQTVKNARLMVYTATPNFPIAIPRNRPENKKNLAKDYIAYLYSDRAQKIHAQQLRGLTMPVDYTPDESAHVSDFIQTRLECFGNDMVPVFPVCASPMVYRGGLGDLPGVSSVNKILYNGTSSTSILSTCKARLNNQWSVYMQAANSVN